MSGLVVTTDQNKCVSVGLTSLEIEQCPRNSNEMIKHNRHYPENLLLAYKQAYKSPFGFCFA